jgi:hypothetical protein
MEANNIMRPTANLKGNAGPLFFLSREYHKIPWQDYEGKKGFLFRQNA